MDLTVVAGEGGHQLAGGSDGLGVANAFLAPLSVRNFSAATRRAYAYDLLKFLRFLAVRGLALAEVGPTNLFDCLEWQSESRPWAGSVVVRLADRRGAAPATMNRRIAAVRGLFEYAVLTGAGAENPVPAARRATGIRAPRRGLPGHLGPGRKSSGDQLVRQPRRLPESLEAIRRRRVLRGPVHRPGPGDRAGDAARRVRVRRTESGSVLIFSASTSRTCSGLYPSGRCSSIV